MPGDRQPGAATLTAWRESDSLALHAALRLNLELSRKKRGTIVHSTTSLSASYGMPVKPINRAKQLLGSLGIIAKGPGNRWYVALQAPPFAVTPQPEGKVPLTTMTPGESLTPPVPRQHVTMRDRCVKEIASRVAGGQYPPGRWLPRMPLLALELGVSIPTVRLALTELAEAGTIIRVDRVGCYPACGDQPPEDPRPGPGHASADGSTGPHRIEITEGRLGKRYIHVWQLAAVLDVSKMTAYRLAASGEIGGVLRIGRTYRIPLDGAEAYLEKCVVTGPPDDLDELAGEMEEE